MLKIGQGRGRKLTLLGRSVVLLTAELLANAACWIVAGLLFGRREETRGTLSLALLAWTIGLRHGLDADHISAIDNATRGLIGMGQLPVTCGLFFSLGHSSIVIAVNVAIAVSTSVYDKINGVGSIGGIVGTAVSGSFLFIIAVANSIILYRILKARARRKRRAMIDSENGRTAETDDIERGGFIMMKVIGPVTSFVNRPWKMYPVGVLFGFGFDTASSIALLAVSALAKKNSDGSGIAQSDIVILPFLFTAGMSLVDSADSILMLYAYAGAPEKGWKLIKEQAAHDSETLIDAVDSRPKARDELEPAHDSEILIGAANLSLEARDELEPAKIKRDNEALKTHNVNSKSPVPCIVEEATETSISSHESTLPTQPQTLRLKQHTMSTLSILLTLISILVAFSISLIEIMGLIGENCSSCQAAANDPDGGGLAGSWWRAWTRANDESGYVGAAIVGGFIVILGVWYGSKWATRTWARKQWSEERE